MADTLHDKEMVFVTKFDYLFAEPQRQDVVICHYPDRREYFVKRLIGLPGDVIDIRHDLQSKENVVFINDVPLQEPYLTPTRNTMAFKAMDSITLGEDEYFVMGDNRDNSNDSRNLSVVGPISRKSIVGHVRFVFFPFNAWRGIQ
ncbi:MAG: signal peptidase I, partial [Clostridiales bacterium]|nr:signal peptidase I [Clostridiales bacterium]